MQHTGKKDKHHYKNSFFGKIKPLECGEGNFKETDTPLEQNLHLKIPKTHRAPQHHNSKGTSP